MIAGHVMPSLEQMKSLVPKHDKRHLKKQTKKTHQVHVKRRLAFDRCLKFHIQFYAKRDIPFLSKL